jgi:flagellar biosynthesis protein FlhA
MVPLLDLEPVELEIGYALVELVGTTQGGDLLHRVVQVRRSCATDMGVLVPPIRIRDNLQLRPGQYRIRIYGQTVGEGECMSHRVLAMTAGSELGNRIQGIPVKDPVFGLAAVWIAESNREQVEMSGITVVEPSAVIATHLSEILRNHAPDLLGRQDVQELVEHLRAKSPKLVDDVIPARVSLTQLRRVMQNLLKERISVRDLRTILETLADYAGPEIDAAWLTEKVRESLARAILQELLAGDQSLRVVALAPSLEASLEAALPGGKGIDPKRLTSITARIAKAAANMAQQGWNPVIVSSQRVRPLVRRLTQRHIPTLVALSYEELLPDIVIDTVGVVQDDQPVG